MSDDKGKCAVCDAPAAVVASSHLGAVSFPYCEACVATDAEPYEQAVAYTASVGIVEEAALSREGRIIVEATAARAGKTVETFWADVKARAEKQGATT